MSNISKQDIILKFINNLFTIKIDVDVLSMIATHVNKETTPVLYSTINIWRASNSVVLLEDYMYDYENKLTQIYKSSNVGDLLLLLEFFRILIINELDDLCVYVDVSEQLSQIVLFIFICFYNQDSVCALNKVVNTYVESNYDIVKDIRDEVVVVLGGDF